MPTNTSTDHAPAEAGAESAPGGTVTDAPSEPESGPTTDPGPQLISERIDDLTDTASLAMDIAKSVADLVSDMLQASSETIANAVQKTAHAVAKAVDSVMDALLGGGGVPEPVKDVLASVGHVAADLARALGSALGKLLGGGGVPGPIGDVIGRIGGLVANLANSVAQALGGTLDALLGGAGPAAATTGNPLVQPLTSHPNSSWQTNGVIGRAAVAAAAATASLARETGRALGSAGSLATSSATNPRPGPPHGRSVPPVAPQPLAPIAPPGGPAPAGYSSLLSASGASPHAFQHLFVVLVALLAVLLRGGSLSWHRLEPHRPRSALRLAVERPG